jgi:hypothetical protein
MYISKCIGYLPRAGLGLRVVEFLLFSMLFRRQRGICEEVFEAGWFIL